MGRAENRKMKKHIKSKMTEEQFKVFQSEVNQEYTLDKAKMVLDDVELIMFRKVEEKKKNSAGRVPAVKGRL